MEKFLFLIRVDLEARANMAPAEFRHDVQLMGKWIESMSRSGNYLEADALHNHGTKNFLSGPWRRRPCAGK
jgi:hypothetical protein